jgi:hypothetical protein
MFRFRSLALLAGLSPYLLLTPAAQAGGGVSVWPGAAPCNTTLQACIDATPDGDVVSINTDASIAESLNLYNRSLSVVAASGRRPSLASGNWITVSSAPILGDQHVTLRGLRLTNGYVGATYLGTGTATYDFSGLVLEQTNTAPTYLRVEGRTGNTVQARVYDNRVTGLPRNLNAGLIELVNGGGTLNASAYYNDLRSTSTIAVNGAGIFVDTTGGGTGTVKLHGNTVRGGFYRAGLFVSEGLFSSTASDFQARVYSNVVICADNTSGDGTSGTGISFTAGNGHIGGQAVNNTLTRCSNGINANQWSGGGAGAVIDGIVKNNLIVGTRGLAFTTGLTAGLSNDYNLLNVSNNFTAPGPNTITANASLVALDAPRLRTDSPAINAADTTTLGLGIIINGLSTNDADGLRRIKGGSPSQADIGAYEYGDRELLHVATAANTSGSYITRIDDALLDGQSEANPIATPNWNGSGAGVPNDNAFGIYYFGGKWRLFNEDQTTPVPVGAAYNTFMPAAGSGSFRHVSSAANSAGFTTRLDDGSVNNLPDRIILATQNWSAGSGVYNAHPIGLQYIPVAPGRWQIVNIDQAASGGMALDAGFNIYAQEASPNAFRVIATTAGSSVVLDHPLLNDVPCARLHVTRLHNGSSVPRNFDVYYGSGDGRWRIFSYSSLSVGMQFNVVVDPAQVHACTDRIFANGFQ